jgi:hypothetical protein
VNFATRLTSGLVKKPAFLAVRNLWNLPSEFFSINTAESYLRSPTSTRIDVESKHKWAQSPKQKLPVAHMVVGWVLHSRLGTSVQGMHPTIRTSLSDLTAEQPQSRPADLSTIGIISFSLSPQPSTGSVCGWERGLSSCIAAQ